MVMILLIIIVLLIHLLEMLEILYKKILNLKIKIKNLFQSFDLCFFFIFSILSFSYHFLLYIFDHCNYNLYLIVS